MIITLIIFGLSSRQRWFVIEQAPAIVLAVSTLGLGLSAPLTPEKRIYKTCNYRSIGAAIENMTLEAAKLGLGSLWIHDVFFVYRELEEWMNAEGELAAVLSIGYGDETPAPRPRRPLKETTTWRSWYLFPVLVPFKRVGSVWFWYGGGAIFLPPPYFKKQDEKHIDLQNDIQYIASCM